MCSLGYSLINTAFIYILFVIVLMLYLHSTTTDNALRTLYVTLYTRGFTWFTEQQYAIHKQRLHTDTQT